MNRLLEGPPARAERYATKMLHDDANARVIAFHLLPGQSVPPHSTESTVIVQVTEGEGLFRGTDGEVRLGAGDTVVYAPSELHSMEPVGGPLRFLAIIAPRPR